MAISAEVIEVYEKEMEAQRQARASRGGSGTIAVSIISGATSSGGNEIVTSSVAVAEGINRRAIPRPVFTRRDEEVMVVVTAMSHVDDSHTYARSLRFKRFRIRGTYSVDVAFNPPVRVDEEGIYVGVPRERGKARLKGSQWRPLDPWLPFSGNKEDRSLLKQLGGRIL